MVLVELLYLSNLKAHLFKFQKYDSRSRKYEKGKKSKTILRPHVLNVPSEQKINYYII